MITRRTVCASITGMAQLAVTHPCPGGDTAGSRPDAAPVQAPRLWREIALIVVFYAAYTGVRLLIPHDGTAAYAHAGQVLRLERALDIDAELGLNHALMDVPWLARLANLFYATAHFAVTLGVLVWLYRRRPAHFARLRTSLMIATAVALIGFWVYPLAPPRFLGGLGYVDPVTALHTFGLYSSPAAGSMTNQFAAMPSMHAGWALWCAFSVVTLARRPLVRILAALYPIVTIMVIFSTANHYVVDVVAGLMITVVALITGFALHRPGNGDQRAKDHKVTNKTTVGGCSPHSI